MANVYARAAFIPVLCLPLTLACGSPEPSIVPTSSTGSGGGAGTSASGGSAGSAGAASAGAAGAAGASGTGGAAGAAGASGAAGNAGSAGTPNVMGGVRTGMSAGCGTSPPGDDTSDDYTTHEVTITGLDPVYLSGGELYESDGPWDFSHRPYGVKLPANYDPTKPYTVTFGGGGCGGHADGFASNPGGGLQMANDGTTIQIGLSYISGCFNDGGPSIDNRTDTPEQPYFRAVMADIEAHYCIDLAKVFIGGYSSGAWEAYTLGCAVADLVRGIGADEGGMRNAHPECKGPVAAVLVAGEADTENPIGPLDPNNPDDEGAIDRLGSYGSAPGRDDILQRNGCLGTATEPYPAPYSACVKYSGCPANYPVVWCALPGVGHNSSTYDGQDYSPGPMWDVLGALPPP